LAIFGDLQVAILEYLAIFNYNNIGRSAAAFIGISAANAKFTADASAKSTLQN
jgi:hypothetical protein